MNIYTLNAKFYAWYEVSSLMYRVKSNKHSGVSMNSFSHCYEVLCCNVATHNTQLTTNELYTVYLLHNMWRSLEKGTTLSVRSFWSKIVNHEVDSPRIHLSP